MQKNRENFMKRAVFLLWTAVMFFSLCSCSLIRIEEEERKPVSYTVVKKQEIPGELSSIIEEKKEKEFQITYEKDEDLYLARGYGRQMSGGYSIQVEELGVSENTLFFVTKLIGPGDLKEAGVPSYPYIVIKTKAHRESVVFQ